MEEERAREKRDIWADYDPERARAGFEGIIGLLAGSDTDDEAWNEDIREQRGQYRTGRPYDPFENDVTVPS